jgi:TRAP-type C4-dicarboxylate transport system permease small subunit
MQTAYAALQRLLTICTHTIAWCVLALALLLFAQWPLRDLVKAYSREANDLAQIFFALLASASVAAAGMAGTHLSAHIGTAEATDGGSAWRRWALAACVLPWAAFMLWASAPQVWAAVIHLERFSETSNPGFFLIKCAGLLLVVLVAIQTLLQLRRPPSTAATQTAIDRTNP